MDFALYLRVLWRFRALIAAGLLVSAALATLSYVRVDLDGMTPTVSYRADETWESSATILVSEPGFPAGVSLLEDPAAAADAQRRPDERVYSDPARFEGLAVLYAKFAESDAVERTVYAGGRADGTYSAQPMKTDDGAHYLPFVLITARSNAPEEAQDLAARATTALRSYIARNQEESGIPEDRRVQVPVVSRPDSATLAAGRSPVLPVLILLVGLAATLGLAFLLENLRPRTRPVAASPVPIAAPETRRSAQAR